MAVENVSGKFIPVDSCRNERAPISLPERRTDYAVAAEKDDTLKFDPRSRTVSIGIVRVQAERFPVINTQGLVWSGALYTLNAACVDERCSIIVRWHRTGCGEMHRFAINAKAARNFGMTARSRHPIEWYVFNINAARWICIWATEQTRAK